MLKASIAPLFLLLHPALVGQTVKDNWHTFTTQTFTLGTVFTPAATALGSNGITKPKGFGSGPEGYGYHYGVGLADNVNGKFMRSFLLPELTRSNEQDYVRLGSSQRPWSRLGHALKHSIVNEKGRFNWSSIPASVSASALSTAYQPVEQQNWKAFGKRVGTTQVGFVIGDLGSEFLCGVHVFEKLVSCKKP